MLFLPLPPGPALLRLEDGLNRRTAAAAGAAAEASSPSASPAPAAASPPPAALCKSKGADCANPCGCCGSAASKAGARLPALRLCSCFHARSRSGEAKKRAASDPEARGEKEDEEEDKKG